MFPATIIGSHREENKTMKTCLVMIVLLVVLVAFSTLLTAFILRIGWNYVAVDALELSSRYLTWKAAIIMSFVFSVVGSFFRSSSSKS